MIRVITYIDGFNLYFGLRESNLKRLYWLDVAKLSQSILRPDQTLEQTRYFTARIRGKGPKIADVQRQSTYIDALLTRPNLVVQEGHFLEKSVTCKSCGKSWQTYEEKMTDVNIAVGLLGDAMNDRFDTALVISGDSDLTTPVRQVVAQFPEKRVIVAFPPKRHSTALKQVANGFIVIGEDKLRQSQLPETVVTANGTELRRPATWK